MSQERRIPSLDGWRAFSVLLVIFSHQIKNNFEYSSSHFLRTLCVFNLGRYGVYIFFVISGFIITTLFINERKVSNTISLSKFYIRRFFRIMPAYYTYLIIIFIISMIKGVHDITWQSWFKSFFFVSNYTFWGIVPWVINHSWSLSVEEQYYLIWPLIYKYKIKYFPYIVVIVLPILRFFYYKNLYEMNVISFLFNADCIFWGAIFAINMNKQNFNTKIKLLKYIVLLLPIMFIVEKFGFSSIIPLIQCIIPTVFSLTVIYLIYTSFNEKTVLFKVLNTKIAVFIGSISYSLYLWQQLFYDNLSILGKTFYTLFPLNILFMFLCAYLSYTLIEKRFLKLRNKVL